MKKMKNKSNRTKKSYTSSRQNRIRRLRDAVSARKKKPVILRQDLEIHKKIIKAIDEST